METSLLPRGSGGAAVGLPRRAAALKRAAAAAAAAAPPPSPAARSRNWHLEALARWQASRGGRAIAVGVLNMNRTIKQHIAHPGPKNMQTCLELTPWACGSTVRGTDYARTRFLDPIQFTDAVLKDFDVVIVPGGSATSQAKRLGPSGCDALVRFVENGGGYVGVCAGAFLAAAGYWRRRRANWFNGSKKAAAAARKRGRAPTAAWPLEERCDPAMAALAAPDAPWLLRADVVLATAAADTSRGAWERGGAMLPLIWTALGALLLWDEAGDGDGDGAEEAAATTTESGTPAVRYHNGPILVPLAGEAAAEAAAADVRAEHASAPLGFGLVPLALFGGEVAEGDLAPREVMVGAMAIAANRCRPRWPSWSSSDDDGDGVRSGAAPALASGGGGGGGIVVAISPHPESTHEDGRMDPNVGEPRMRRIIQRAVMLAAGVFDGPSGGEE